MAEELKRVIVWSLPEGIELEGVSDLIEIYDHVTVMFETETGPDAREYWADMVCEDTPGNRMAIEVACRECMQLEKRKYLLFSDLVKLTRRKF